MLPADGILRAAERWLRLLSRSSFTQASALVRSGTDYTDLSPTQYASALEWLQQVGLIVASTTDLRLACELQNLPETEIRQTLFNQGLQEMAPLWLADADTLVRDVSELPQDALELASALRLSERAALIGVRQVQGQVDLVERARVGAEGEVQLVALLEDAWAGCARHVALDNDALGYDIVVSLDSQVWHLEVKTTTRRGRLNVYLSRNEYEVGSIDPQWRLVVVGLGDNEQLTAVATVKQEILHDRTPLDRHVASRWESCRYELTPSDMEAGLSFLNENQKTRDPRFALGLPHNDDSTFAWMVSNKPTSHN